MDLRCRVGGRFLISRYPAWHCRIPLAGNDTDDVMNAVLITRHIAARCASLDCILGGKNAANVQI
jgi:hypothetical protein